MFKFLDGYKTIIGIVGAIATFVLVICTSLADGFQFVDVEIIMGGFSALLVAIGLAHKAVKIETALKK